jgi:hypothetical protein
VEIHGLRFFVLRARAATEFVAALEPGEAAVVGSSETLVIRTADGAIAVERALLSDDALAADGEEESAELPLDEHPLAALVQAHLRSHSHP